MTQDKIKTMANIGTSKRKSIARTVSYGLTVLITVFISLSLLTLWSINHLSATLDQITHSAIPKNTEGSQLLQLSQHLLYETERLATATSNPARRLAEGELNITLDSLENIINGDTYKDKQVVSNFYILQTTLSELSNLVEMRINVDKKTRRALADLFTLEEAIMQFNAEIQPKIKDQTIADSFHQWITKTQLIINHANSTDTLTILYRVKKAEKDIYQEYEDLEALSAKLSDTIQDETSLLDAKLGHIIFNKNGLMHLLKERQRISNKSATRANFTRSLVKEFETATNILFETISQETTNSIDQLSDKLAQLTAMFISFSLGAILTTAGVVFYFHRNITRRLVKLNQAILDRRDGQDILIEDTRNDEIADMTKSFNFYADEVDAREDKLIELATKDPLTGISNRRNFLEKGEKELKRAKRFSHSATFLMLDIDHFKNINDTYGHHVGDIILKDFTHCCTSILREVDCFGRIGGEEFAVLLPETGKIKGFKVAERLRMAIEQLEWNIDNITVTCTTSVGLATLTQEDVSLDGLMKRADNALYQAKRNGRNLSCHYTDIAKPA